MHLAEISSLYLTDPLGPQVLFLTRWFAFAVGCVGCLQPALSEMTRGFGGYYSKISQSETLQELDSPKMLGKKTKTKQK